MSEKKKSYGVEYRRNFFAKPNRLILCIHENHLEGKGFENDGNKMVECNFTIQMKHIVEIRKKEIAGENWLVIDYKALRGSEPQVYSIYFPEFADMDSVLGIKESWEEETRKRIAEEKRKRELLEREELEKKQRREQKKAFYEECLDFHIRTDNNPCYVIHEEGLQFVGIYIDKEKSINFVSIDGDRQRDSNACILYEDVHYYEKAGSIHYTTEVNGKFENFGGSFKGGTISKKMAGIGGLLFGAMGLMAGAILSHEPTEATASDTQYHISSEVVKIDDRSVILNYYSRVKNLLMDIELPSDMYNFLQTYLPDKKYGIVLELEKKKAIAETGENRIAIESTERVGIANSEIQTFENRIKKLMILKENGLLTEEEFAAEKKKILEDV